MGAYDDIINLPHHKSAVHPHMSEYDRAAQFSPFAALTGHGEAILETARLTEARVELDEDEKEHLNHKMTELLSNHDDRPQIRVTYFLADSRKDGGCYMTKEGYIRKIDLQERRIALRIPGENGPDGWDASELIISLDDIYDIEEI